MKNKTLNITIFAIAMAALESAVVVYLRELYYTDGFDIHFRIIKPLILNTELIRELATIIMLWGVSAIISEKKYHRLAWFLYAFAIWDIFYYVWLKVFINWPTHILEWDILFLLPFTWLGPVLAPILCSILMIIMSFVILHYDKIPQLKEWTLWISGSIFILYTFMYDYGNLIIVKGYWKSLSTLLTNHQFLQDAAQLEPVPFQWGLFILGIFIISIGLINYTLPQLKLKKIKI